MGICSSCLGLGRNSKRGTESSNPETSRLLSDDPYRSQYGSTNGQRQQQDPEMQRREREILKGFCHAMSDDVVDIYTALPSKQGLEQTQGLPPTKNDIILQKHSPRDQKQTAQENAYRSIRRSQKARISTPLEKNENWEAAKAVMG